MDSSIWKEKKYKVALVLFVLGLIVLIVPVVKKVTELPVTGVEPVLTIALSADKGDVQRDDPTENAQEVSYEIKVTNEAECVETPANVILAYDKSGSMRGLIAEAKTAGISFVRNLDFTKDRVGIVSYADNALLELELSDSESDIVSTINSISTYGMTNIGDAVATANTELLAK